MAGGLEQRFDVFPGEAGVNLEVEDGPAGKGVELVHSAQDVVADLLGGGALHEVAAVRVKLYSEAEASATAGEVGGLPKGELGPEDGDAELGEVLEERGDLTAGVEEDGDAGAACGFEEPLVTGAKETPPDGRREDGGLLGAEVVTEGDAVGAKGKGAAHRVEPMVDEAVGETVDFGGVLEDVDDDVLEVAEGVHRFEDGAGVFQVEEGAAEALGVGAGGVEVGTFEGAGGREAVGVEVGHVGQRVIEDATPDAEDAVLPANAPFVGATGEVASLGVEVFRCGGRGEGDRVEGAEVVTGGADEVEELLAVVVEAARGGEYAQGDDVDGSEVQGGKDAITGQHKGLR